jgi:hypothetical protein
VDRFIDFSSLPARAGSALFGNNIPQIDILHKRSGENRAFLAKISVNFFCPNEAPGS